MFIENTTKMPGKVFEAAPLQITTVSHKQFYDDATTIQNYVENLASSGTTLVVKRPGAEDKSVKKQLRQLDTFKVPHSYVSLSSDSDSHNTVWSGILKKYGCLFIGDYFLFSGGKRVACLASVILDALELRKQVKNW